jgi:hypothetical protein
MKMTSDKEGVTETGRRVEVGTEVEYICFVVGGMVRVRLPDGTEDVMNPRCFKALR